MKLSIWQQFSSNHSANYAVVGKFETAQKAKEIADELRDFSLKIFMTTPERIEIEGQHRVYIPTTVEIEMGQKYGVEWKHGVDWGDFVDPKVNIKIVRDTVWCRNPHWLTWQAPVELINLLDAMGAEQVATNGELFYGTPSRPNTNILLDIRCDVLDEGRLKELYKTFALEFAEKIIEERWGLFNEASRTGLNFEYNAITWNYKKNNILFFETRRSDISLELNGLILSSGSEEHSLSQLLDYLENEGCTNIQYHFREEVTIHPDEIEDE